MSALRQPAFDRGRRSATDPAPQSLASSLRQGMPDRYYSPQPQFQPQKNNYQKLTNPNRKQVRKVVKSRSFPQQNKLPHDLQLLSLLQKGSFGIALVSLAASLGLYTSTVKIPELWSLEYRNLENLQRQERELTAINEKIKYQIAHEASKDNRLSISQPDSAVFIAPAKVNLKHGSSIDSNNTQTSIRHTSLGY